MSAELSLRMETTLDELRRIDAVIEEFARAENWSPELEFQVKLVFEEIGINIVNHGHDGDGHHEIEIQIISDMDKISVEITDDARPFNPLTDTPPPDTNASLEDRPEGGLGIHLVRTLMDEVRYRRESGKNLLTLVKRKNG